MGNAELRMQERRETKMDTSASRRREFSVLLLGSEVRLATSPK